MNAANKTVTINGTDYLIGRLSALDGNWILGRWTEKWGEGRASAALAAAQNPATAPQTAPETASPSSAPAAEAPRAPNREQGTLAMASFLIPKLTRDELRQVQDICLDRCSRFEEAGGRPIAMPILAGPGVFAIAALENDGPTILRLVQESIAFNIAPYFPDAGSNARQ